MANGIILDSDMLNITIPQEPEEAVERGGEGSGHHGHEGREGEVGGSEPGPGGGKPDAKAPHDRKAAGTAIQSLREQISGLTRLKGETTPEWHARKGALQDELSALIDVDEAHERGLRAEAVAELHERIDAGLEHPTTLSKGEYSDLAWRDFPDREDRPSSETDEGYKMFQESLIRKRLWTVQMGKAVARGEIPPEEARDLGYYEGPANPEDWKPMPEKVWHVTTASDAVQENGLMTRAELSDHTGNGLGGGTSDAISFTDDPAVAEFIYHAIVEAQQVARGEKTVQDMLDEAQAGGGGADKPYLKDWMQYYKKDWGEGDPLPYGIDNEARGVIADRHIGIGRRTLEEQIASEGDLGWRPHPEAEARGDTNDQGEAVYHVFERPMNDQERSQRSMDTFKAFSMFRQSWGGGYEDPLFFSSDSVALANLDTDQIRILEFDGNGVGWQVSALGEWRAPSGDAVTFSKVVEPTGHRLTRAEIELGINRERERRGMEPLEERADLQDGDLRPAPPSTRFYTSGASGPGIDDERGVIEAIAKHPETIANGTEILAESGKLKGPWRVEGRVMRHQEKRNRTFRLPEFFDQVEDLESLTLSTTRFLAKSDDMTFDDDVPQDQQRMRFMIRLTEGEDQPETLFRFMVLPDKTISDRFDRQQDMWVEAPNIMGFTGIGAAQGITEIGEEEANQIIQDWGVNPPAVEPPPPPVEAEEEAPEEPSVEIKDESFGEIGERGFHLTGSLRRLTEDDEEEEDEEKEY